MFFSLFFPEDSALSSSSLGTLRSDSSSSSEYLFKIPGVSSEGSLESNEDSDHTNSPPSRKQAKSFKIKTRYSNSDSQWSHCLGRAGGCSQHLVLPKPPAYTGPKDLATFLEEIGCLKYLQVFEEQDVDLRIFLTLTESDLKEIGITLFGPKRKMTSAIARWHSSARPPSDALELAYADRLEAEMQELAIQLHKRCQEVQVMKGQVCQEQKLRAVAESCLMERDETWNTIQCRLREAQAITKDAGVLLDQIKSCQAELSSRLAPAGDGAPGTQEQHGTGESQRPGERPVLEGWPPSLKSLSLPELSAVLEKCVGEMGKVGRTLGMWREGLLCCGRRGWEWVLGQSLLLQGSLQALELVLFLLILGSASSPGDRSGVGGGPCISCSVVKAAGELSCSPGDRKLSQQLADSRDTPVFRAGRQHSRG
uniref:Ankyrin repeat and SAM domain-containing protein 3-like n=1 Tax=Cyanistes caeruleus TaxID=156563 RepID=A0A8C0TXB8_CYACU